MTDSIDQERIREHYDRIRPVIRELADVDNHPTIGLNDYYGWYIKHDAIDVKAIEEGYPEVGRCATFHRDYDTLVDRIERTLYGVTTYKDGDALERDEPCARDEDSGETVWKNDTPMPTARDLRAVPAWGDIDLADDLKTERGNLDDDTKAIVEATLDAYIDEFADLYGTRDAVSALDSVGGAYIFGAPAATLPIAEFFASDEDALERVMQAVLDRTNAYLKNAEARVNERVDGAADVIHPDWVNNRNRQYKAPLAIHAKHDAVVTPIDTTDVTYDITPLDDVDDDLIDDAETWARNLTNPSYTDCVDALVESLWPDEYSDNETWQSALGEWVAAERAREEKEERARERAAIRREKRLEEIGDRIEESSVTPFLQDVYDAVDAVDTGEVVRRFASDGWDTGRDSDTKIEFNPSWRASDSGTSCFVDTEKNTFGDPGRGGGGYADRAMALGSPNIAYNDPSDPLQGEKWRDAIDELRDAGYDIPIWVPEKGGTRSDGDEYEKMPFWAVRKAALALDVIPEAALVMKQGEDGTGYLGFPGPGSYNNALEAIEYAGLEHGREYADDDRPGRPAPENVPVDDDSAPAEAATDGALAATPTDDGPSIPDSDNWDRIRNFYDDPDVENIHARHFAVEKLKDDLDFVTAKDTQDLYIYYEEAGVFERGGERDVEHILQRELKEYYSQYEKNEIIGALKAATYCDRDEFNAGNFDEPLMCVGNGVLNVKTRDLLDHDPRFKFTQSIPVEYHESASAPNIERFLDDITARGPDKATLYEMVGNTLAPHYNHQKFMVLFGEGSNGKSTFFEVIEEMLGSENVSGWELHDLNENRFATSSLANKLANIAPDLSGAKIQDMSRVKALTGGDTVMAEEKGKPAFEFTNTAKLMFGANRPPVLGERSHAIKRRLVPIHLPYEFTDDPNDGNPDRRDPNELLAELTSPEELSGLLNAALDGLERLRENGDVSLPETPEERLEYYEQFSDPIKEFGVNCITNEAGASTPKSVVYDAYKQFSTENNYSIRSKNVFFRQLRKTAFTYDEHRPTIDGERVVCLKGATLTDIGEEYCSDILQDSRVTIDTAGADRSDTPLADIEPGYADVTVEVRAIEEPDHDNAPDVVGTVKDTTGIVDFVDFFGGVCDIVEDQCYRIENARVGYDPEGTPQLEFVRNVTEAVPIQRGVGTTPRPGDDDDDDVDPANTRNMNLKDVSDENDDVDEDETPNADEDDEDEDAVDENESENDTDAEELSTEDLDRLIQQVVTKQSEPTNGADRTEVVEEIVDRGGDPDHIDHRISKLLERGELYEPMDGELRTT